MAFRGSINAPTMSSSKKKAESMPSKMHIRVDFERPMVRVAERRLVLFGRYLHVDAMPSSGRIRGRSSLRAGRVAVSVCTPDTVYNHIRKRMMRVENVSQMGTFLSNSSDNRLLAATPLKHQSKRRQRCPTSERTRITPQSQENQDLDFTYHPASLPLTFSLFQFTNSAPTMLAHNAQFVRCLRKWRSTKTPSPRRLQPTLLMHDTS